MKSIVVFNVLLAIAHAQLDMTSDKKMEYEDNIAEESQSNERVFTDVIGSKPLLNDGKPFYVQRDPTTGTLDFNSKKTVGLSNDIPISRKDEIVGGSSKGHDINSIGHTFHDYLNIPVKYSSSKFVYPLISSSYSNFKYQGSNKNHQSNHKNYTSTLGTTTMSPKYFTHIITSKSYTESTTKAPAPTRRIFTISTTEAPKPTTYSTTKRFTTTTTTRKPDSTTTKAPETTSTTTKVPETTSTTIKITSPSTIITTESSEAPSTVKYSSTIIQSNQFPSTFKKYVDSSETRKKFTTRAPEPSPTMPANPVKFLDDLLETIERKEQTTATTYRPQIDRLSFATSMPLRPSAFKPMPTESPPRDHSQKVVFEKGVDPAAMTLSEIFNSIAGNDNLSDEKNEIIYEPADTMNIEVKKPLPLSPISAFQTTPVPAQTTQQQHKTLQQQMKEPQNPKPNQFVDFSNNQFAGGPPQSSYAPQHTPQFGSSHIGFPDDTFDDYVEFENPGDQYVRYEVQKPNLNADKYNQMPIPNMNNVVISPGQNSASFVLGSQQNVGSIGIGSSLGVGTPTGFTENKGPVKMGQVINDEPPIRPGVNPIQASIRFPSDIDSNFDNAPIIKGTFKYEGSTEAVQPPQALAQNQQTQFNQNPQNQQGQFNQNSQNQQYQFNSNAQNNQKPLVFPSSEQNVMHAELSVGIPAPAKQPSNPSQIIFENVNDIYEKVNEKKKAPPKEIGSNELSPPMSLIPPNPHQFNQFNRQPQYGPQKRIQKPNILPQFRPNSRVSQGHPQYRPEVGSIRVQNPQFRPFPPQQAIPKVGLPPMNPNMRRIPQNQQGQPPQYFNRPRPQNVPQNIPQNMEANRRVFKVPPPQQFPYADRYMKPPPMQQPPTYYLNRPITANPPETMQMQQRPSIIPYQDVELHKSLPPTPAIQPVNSSVNVNSEDGNGKLEPVITLQMLQLKKPGSPKLNIPSVPNEISQDLSYQPSYQQSYQQPAQPIMPQAQNIQTIPKNHKGEPIPYKNEPSVYVVYPVTSNNSPLTQNQQQVEVPKDQDYEGEKSDEQPIKHEYQNTPFAVVSHFEQEPLLMKKDRKRPAFPYQIEKPAPPHVTEPQIPVKFNVQHVHPVYNIGEEPHDPISSKLTRVTEKPIAIAYTPTEPNRVSPPMSYYQHIQPQNLYNSNKFSLPNYAGPVISEIMDDYDYYHKNQAHLNGGEELNDYHRPHYDFEAPFHASVSLTPEVTNPYQGWSIVTKPTDSTNKIDRSDHNLVDSSAEEVSTAKFDPNEFHPILESGFQPIYSSNRVSTAPELIRSESHELPSTLALSQQTSSIIPQSTTQSTLLISSSSNEHKKRDEIVSTSATKVAVTTTSTTAKPIEINKAPPSMEIDSLEALFDSLTRDYDDDESVNKSENESRSL